MLLQPIQCTVKEVDSGVRWGKIRTTDANNLPYRPQNSLLTETILHHLPISEFSLMAARQVSILAEWYGT